MTMAGDQTEVIATAVSDVRLPALVRRHLERSLSAVSFVPGQVRITQEGEMWRKPGARAMRFTAVEEFALERVAFSWRARFSILPFVAMKVVDDYSEGDGQLRASVLGFPVMRQRGPETVAGEALRYLAELPWIPHAMLLNRELEWRELDAQNVEVAAQVADERLAVRVGFATGGDIVSIWCDSRPRPVGKTFVPTPWAGTFGEYAVVAGARIPTWAEVRWELPEGPFVYWRGTVTSLELIADECKR
jgi:hypothetical protein